MTDFPYWTFIGGGLVGSILTNSLNAFKGRKQKMKCHYIEDDILSKIPIKTVNDEVHDNIYVKRFKVINSTNIDISEFKIIFQFDTSAKVIECYSKSKEGHDKQKIRANNKINNQAEAIVRLFNRGDEIEFTIKVANISENSYYISEANCLGFKIVCKDKRKYTNKSKSKQSNNILVKRSA